MAVFMLDDVAGSVEVVVFPETFGKHGSLIEADAMLLVRGKLEKDEESARLVATELMPIAALKERTTRKWRSTCGAAARPADVRGARRAAVAASRRPPRVARARRQRPAPSRCACAPTSPNACGRRSGSSRKSNSSAAPDRWSCR